MSSWSSIHHTLDFFSFLSSFSPPPFFGFTGRFHFLQFSVVPKNDRDDQYGSVFMVFEYCDFDLQGLMNAPNVRISPMHCKSYIKQLLAGVAYIHKSRILHRDLKSSNLVRYKNVIF
jgi:serine/threonine protein kinase